MLGSSAAPLYPDCKVDAELFAAAPNALFEKITKQYLKKKPDVSGTATVGDAYKIAV